MGFSELKIETSLGKTPEELQLSALILKICEQPENRHCADCKVNEAKWSSWNLGVFICIQCAGIHRGLGTHISKVKSVDLDTWKLVEIQCVQRWGNHVANAYWEYKLGKSFVPDIKTIREFIQNKYVHRHWVAPEDHQLLFNASSNILPASYMISSSTTATHSIPLHDGTTSSRVIRGNTQAPVRLVQPSNNSIAISQQQSHHYFNNTMQPTMSSYAPPIHNQQYHQLYSQVSYENVPQYTSSSKTSGPTPWHSYSTSSPPGIQPMMVQSPFRYISPQGTSMEPTDYPYEDDPPITPPSHPFVQTISRPIYQPTSRQGSYQQTNGTTNFGRMVQPSWPAGKDRKQQR